MMYNAHPRYQCFPSVVCVGEEREIRIFPRDVSRRFLPDREYRMQVLGLLEDQLDYHDVLPMDHPCTVKDGCLCFTYRFDREQEYAVHFTENGGKPVKVFLYAVKEDLYALRPLKGDLHTHTYYSDGQDGIPQTPADYREEGFDFFALTDHNRLYPSQLISELFRDIPLGIHMMTGEEVHTPGSMLHIVHVGGKESVCDRYVNHREEFDAEIAALEATLSHVDEQYRHRFAMGSRKHSESRWSGYFCPSLLDASPLRGVGRLSESSHGRKDLRCPGDSERNPLPLQQYADRPLAGAGDEGELSSSRGKQ